MISYLITVCNEHEELDRLLKSIFPKDEDEVVIQYDTNQVTSEVLEVIERYVELNSDTIVHGESFDGDFSKYKNIANSLCKKDWIFQLDADEYPSKDLAENITDIIQSNSESLDLIYIPRVNTVDGITIEHIKKWSWNISSDDLIQNHREIEKFDDNFFMLKHFDLVLSENEIQDRLSIMYKEPIINFPDYQARLYRNKDTIQWKGKFHETIIGASIVSRLPLDKVYCLYHPKNIDRQEKQNELYKSL